MQSLHFNLLETFLWLCILNIASACTLIFSWTILTIYLSTIAFSVPRAYWIFSLRRERELEIEVVVDHCPNSLGKGGRHHLISKNISTKRIEIWNGIFQISPSSKSSQLFFTNFTSLIWCLLSIERHETRVQYPKQALESILSERYNPRQWQCEVRWPVRFLTALGPQIHASYN